MKNTMIVLALAFMLLLVGCSQTGIDIGDNEPPSAPDTTQGDEPQETPAETPRETPAATPSPTGAPAGPGSALTEDDFSIVVDGVTIAIGADPALVFDAFGKEENEFWLMTESTDESQTYCYDYEGFSILVDTYMDTGTSEISWIEMRGVATRRGIAPGDSYEDLLDQYGEPDEDIIQYGEDEEEADGREKETVCIYRFGERTIRFPLNEDDMKIELIIIR